MSNMSKIKKLPLENANKTCYHRYVCVFGIEYIYLALN